MFEYTQTDHDNKANDRIKGVEPCLEPAKHGNI